MSSLQDHLHYRCDGDGKESSTNPDERTLEQPSGLPCHVALINPEDLCLFGYVHIKDVAMQEFISNSFRHRWKEGGIIFVSRLSSKALKLERDKEKDTRILLSSGTSSGIQTPISLQPLVRIISTPHNDGFLNTGCAVGLFYTPAGSYQRGASPHRD